MARLMLTDERWSKLRIIMCEQRIYDKPNQRMWQCVFPKNAPLANIGDQQLANLPVASGAIGNIALNAAFLAANDTVAVTMQHLLAVARYEYKKQEKTLTQSIVED